MKRSCVTSEIVKLRSYLANISSPRWFCLFAVLVLFSETSLPQAALLVEHAPWKVEAPEGGCGSLPLLKVKGPGTLFDAANSSALSDVINELEIALQRVCPGVKEVVLENGRARQLIRLAVQSQPSPTPTTPRMPSKSSGAPQPQTEAEGGPVLHTRTPNATAQDSDSRPSAGNALPTDASKPDEILGHWQGVYFVYPDAMRVDLDLRSVNSASGFGVEGTVSFQHLIEDPRRMSMPFQGSYSVKGVYDPVSQTLHLDPLSWIQHPNQLANAQSFFGVFDKGSEMVAGALSIPHQVVSNGSVSWFVLAHEDKAQQALLAPLKRIAVEEQPGRAHPHTCGVVLGGNPFHRPIGCGGEDINKIAGWASRLSSEYPTLNFQNTYALATPTQNLFEDRYFESHFGKTFDQLSEGERYKFVFGLRNYMGERDIQKLQLRQQYAFLGNYFGGFNVPNTLLGVLAQRVLRPWREQTLQKVESPEEADPEAAFNQVDDIAKEADPMLVYLWPSERQTYIKSADEKRATLAGPALLASAQRTSQKAHGIQGAVDLSGWVSTQKNLLKWAGDDAKRQSEVIIQSSIHRILSPIVATEVAKLDSLHNDMNDLQRSRNWLLTFNTSFARFRNDPSVSDAEAKARNLRAQQLAAVSASLTREIKSQTTSADLDRIASQYLMQDDARCEAGSALLTLVMQRSRDLAKADQLREALQHKADALGITVSELNSLKPDANGGPNAGEVYDAVQRRYDAWNEGTKEIITRCKSGNVNAQNDPVLAIGCLGLAPAVLSNQFDFSMAITKLRKLTGSPCINLAPLGKSGFDCTFILGFTQSNPIMTSFLGDLARNGDITEARFLKTQSGWIMMPNQ